MNNGLYGSWFRVTCFWSIALGLYAVPNIFFVPIAFVWEAGIVFVSVLIGLAAYFVYRIYFPSLVVLRAQGGGSLDGAFVSIGVLPERLPPKAVAVKGDIFEGFLHMPSYRKAYPAYAALLDAVARVMATNPNLPASPIPGGHGGANLTQHSLNVMKAMNIVAPDWQFRGHANKDGTYWWKVPTENGRDYHSFDRFDPILPVAAFVHDIGKMLCYEMQPDGRVKEKSETSFTFEGSVLDRDKNKRRKIDHDTMGARMLRTMPELWQIPRDDITALMIAVGYYHKIGSVPASEWINARARSLLELLYVADVKAGEIESGSYVPDNEHPMDETPAISNVIITPPANANQIIDSNIAEKLINNVDANQMGGELANVNSPISEASKKVDSEEGQKKYIASPKVETTPLSNDEYDKFLALLCEKDRINGSDARVKIGLKFGDVLYITDQKMRGALAVAHEDAARYEKDPSGGNGMYPWTAQLTKRLEMEGKLIYQLDGMSFSHKRALFDTMSTAPGHEGKLERFVILVKSNILSTTDRIPDCKTAPSVLKCSWGNHNALNKKGNAAIDEADSIASELESITNGVACDDENIIPEYGDPNLNQNDGEVFDGLEENYSETSSSYTEEGVECGESEILGSIDLEGRLILVARGLDSGPPCKVLESGNAYFDRQEVMEYYGVGDAEIKSLQVLDSTTKSGKVIFVKK